MDVLVVAPHPGDESLGCAGILARAVQQGKTAKVVLLTGGDGFPAMAALLARKPLQNLGPEDAFALTRFRQNQALRAVELLGLKAADLIMLGYPDGGLQPLYESADTEPFRLPFTQRDHTYAVVRQDYHSAAHGRPAPYTRASVLADLAGLIGALKPEAIYVTSEADTHPDHRAALRFVRDAAVEARFHGVFRTYLIHGGAKWPWPDGATPDLPYAICEPVGLPWPPPLRVPLNRELVEIKRQAIRAHSSHLAGAADPDMAAERRYLESFIKCEEVFWPVEVNPVRNGESALG